MESETRRTVHRRATGTADTLYTFQVPGVSPTSFHIEIVNHNLFVYHEMKFAEEGNVPYLIKMLTIPVDVAYQEISAEYKSGALSVKLPYNNLTGGFRKEIKIDEK